MSNGFETMGRRAAAGSGALRLRDGAGLGLLLLGTFAAGSVGTDWVLGGRGDEPNTSTAAVVAAIGFVGAAPLFTGAVLAAILGAWLFLARRAVQGQALALAFGAACLGLPFAAAVIVPGAGGWLGGLLAPEGASGLLRVAALILALSCFAAATYSGAAAFGRSLPKLPVHKFAVSAVASRTKRERASDSEASGGDGAGEREVVPAARRAGSRRDEAHESRQGQGSHPRAAAGGAPRAAAAPGGQSVDPDLAAGVARGTVAPAGGAAVLGSLAQSDRGRPAAEAPVAPVRPAVGAGEPPAQRAGSEGGLPGGVRPKGAAPTVEPSAAPLPAASLGKAAEAPAAKPGPVAAAPLAESSAARPLGAQRAESDRDEAPLKILVAGRPVETDGVEYHEGSVGGVRPLARPLSGSPAPADADSAAARTASTTPGPVSAPLPAPVSSPGAQDSGVARAIGTTPPPAPEPPPLPTGVVGGARARDLGTLTIPPPLSEAGPVAAPTGERPAARPLAGSEGALAEEEAAALASTFDDPEGKTAAEPAEIESDLEAEVDVADEREAEEPGEVDLAEAIEAELEEELDEDAEEEEAEEDDYEAELEEADEEEADEEEVDEEEFLEAEAEEDELEVLAAEEETEDADGSEQELDESPAPIVSEVVEEAEEPAIETPKAKAPKTPKGKAARREGALWERSDLEPTGGPGLFDDPPAAASSAAPPAVSPPEPAAGGSPNSPGPSAQAKDFVLEPVPAPAGGAKGRSRRADGASAQEPRRTKKRAKPQPETRVDLEADGERLIFEAGCLFIQEGRVAVSLLQKRYGLDFEQSTHILDQLQTRGLIGPYLGGQRRDILLDREAWERIAQSVG